MGDSEQTIVKRTWTSELLRSREDFTLTSGDTGYRLAGAVRVFRDETAVEIAYQVDCASDWTTRAAVVEIPELDIDLRLRVDAAFGIVTPPFRAPDGAFSAHLMREKGLAPARPGGVR